MRGWGEGKIVRYDRGDGKKYNLWNIGQWMKKGWKGEKKKNYDRVDIVSDVRLWFKKTY